jgi:pantoate--beta-alanine ligase
MLILKTVQAMKDWRHSLSSLTKLGFVPTMGALHAGHATLLKTSLHDNDVTLASVFVNPLQFGPNEDLSRYPRPFEADVALCEELGVTALFSPDPQNFYAPHHATTISVGGLDRYLCGASRPGHFNGVCTVVAKLFLLTQPTRAYFGKKDIQQAFILKRMVTDLAFPLEMVLVETVRESDGLALSSRNVYLSPEERNRAPAIRNGLDQVLEAYRQGERSAENLKNIMTSALDKAVPNRIDYVEVVGQGDLAPLDTLTEPSLIAVAVFFGNTRLIDNQLLG